MGGELLADPVAEARQLIAHAAEQGLVMRALGGVAVFLQSAGGRPRLVRFVKDIDLAVARGNGKTASRVLQQASYVADEMFNALRGSRRLLYHDPRNGRHVDVFVGEFSMCHELPLTERLDRDPLTVPREALRREDSVPYVYQIVNNELLRRTVQTSISNLTQAEITGGISEGVQVALGAVNSKPLHDHLPVKVVH